MCITRIEMPRTQGACRRFPEVMMTFAMARLRIPAAFLFCLLPGMAASQVMTAYLNHLDIIPLEDPYCDVDWPEFRTPWWTGNSPHLCSAVTVGSIPPAAGTVDAWRGVIDWVLIELRETSGGAGTALPGTIIARKPAFLLSNGRIVDAVAYSRLAAPHPDQCYREAATSDRHCSGVWFDNLTPDRSKNLHVIVRHRNHLAVMSASPMVAIGAGRSDADGVYAYDFTTGIDSAYRGGDAHKTHTGQARSRVELPVPVMVSGETEGDGVISQSDLLGYILSNQGMTEYHLADLNLNGAVQNEDPINYGLPNLRRFQAFRD